MRGAAGELGKTFRQNQRMLLEMLLTGLQIYNDNSHIYKFLGYFSFRADCWEPVSVVIGACPMCFDDLIHFLPKRVHMKPLYQLCLKCPEGK